MHRPIAKFGTTFLLLALGWITISHAEETKPADLVPDSASFVGRWKSPKASLAKLADFVDAVQPGFGGAVTANLREVGRPLGIPDLKGVDVNEDIWVIVFAESQSIPGVVVVATATDVDELKEALPEDYESHSVGKLVVFSADEDALAEVKKRANDQGRPLWSIVDASSRKLFDDADVAILFNVKQLTKDFADELDQAEPQLDDFILRITDAMPAEQRPQMEAIFGIYRDLGKVFLHGVHDTNSWASGLTFTKASIRYEDRIQVTEGSDTAKFLASQPTSDLAILKRLPANKAVYLGMKFDLSSMIEWSMKMTRSILTTASPEQMVQFEEAAKGMSELKYDEINMYLDLDGKSPAVRMGAITMVTPGARVCEITRKLQKSMSEFRSPQFTQTTKLEVNAEKIGGGEVDRLTVIQKIDDAADPLGMQAKMQVMMFGTGGMQQLFMYQPNRTLQTLGGGTAELQSLITAAESTKTINASVATVRKSFMEKANLLVVLDVAKLMYSGLKLAGEQQLMPVDVGLLEKTKLNPSFIGYALACEPTSVRSQIEIPAVQVQNIMKLVSFVRPGPPTP